MGQTNWCRATALLAAAMAVDACALTLLPRPQRVRSSGTLLPLGSALALAPAPSVSSTPELRYALELGLDLLRARLGSLGATLDRGEGEARAGPCLRLEAVAHDDLRVLLRGEGATRDLSRRQLTQAYLLSSSRVDGQVGVYVRASGAKGLYYGLVTLCQLLDAGAEDTAVVPEVTIADWPETGARLSKTSASQNPLRVLRAFAAWQQAMKLNLLGLQYHGNRSGEPEAHFLGSVEALCGECRQHGVLDTVVYFCPFMGGTRAFDFRDPMHRERYVALLTRFLRQGAHGVEVDYNDWPDTTSGVAIEDVVNLVCDGIKADHPEALVFYCPPLDQYRGMAKPELARTLGRVPRHVMTLWTGMRTLISQLRPDDLDEWTRQTGRRPFLWVNRVFIKGQFSRELHEGQGDYVFRAEALPEGLSALVEGVHLNAGLSTGYNRLPRRFTREALIYLATAADYLWNPGAWEAQRSYAAALRFVDVMAPLLPDGIPSYAAGELVPAHHPVWSVCSGEWRERGETVQVWSDGLFAVALLRNALPASARRARITATVRTLELAGNMNGYVVCGQSRASGAYVLAGAAFASQHWVLMHAAAGGKGQEVLRQEAGDIRIDLPHRLRVEVDYVDGTVELREEVEGAWASRLRHQAEGLKGLRPVAGVSNKWGETEFRDLSAE